MAVVKEWKCLMHGPFDSADGRCPSGCTTVVREFRTPPGTRSHKTKASDAALERLAGRFGLSDMSNRNGSVGNSRKHPADMEARWGEMPKGNVFMAGKGEVNEKGEVMSTTGGAIAGLNGMGMTGSVAEILSQKTGRPIAPEPTFMEIAKTLPRVRPVPALRAHDGKFESAAELESAIKSS